jgi:short-subunit dehydrogenase
MSSNKDIIWITGASSGLGAELTKEFCRRGAFVFATARRLEALEVLKLQIENLDLNNDYNLIIKKCDVRSNDDVSESLKSISDKGDLVCLINNAGITSFKRAEDNSIEEIEEIIQTNLLGSIYTIKNVLPEMISRKKGIIINLLSVVTKKIFTNSSAYSASKVGLMGYVNVLREEVRKYNIKIVNVVLGATETSIWSKEMIEKYGSRMMRPEEIADQIAEIYFNQNSIVIEEIVMRPIGGDL